MVWYCREECQTQDWSCHKELCKKETIIRRHDLSREREKSKDLHKNKNPKQQEGQREDRGKTTVTNMMELD